MFIVKVSYSVENTEKSKYLLQALQPNVLIKHWRVDSPVVECSANIDKIFIIYVNHFREITFTYDMQAVSTVALAEINKTSPVYVATACFHVVLFVMYYFILFCVKSTLGVLWLCNIDFFFKVILELCVIHLFSWVHVCGKECTFTHWMLKPHFM